MVYTRVSHDIWWERGNSTPNKYLLLRDFPPKAREMLRDSPFAGRKRVISSSHFQNQSFLSYLAPVRAKHPAPPTPLPHKPPPGLLSFHLRAAFHAGKAKLNNPSGMELYESQFLPNLVRMFLASVEGFGQGEGWMEGWN